MSNKLGFNPASTATTSIVADPIDISKISLYLPFDEDFNDKGPLGVTSTAAGNVSLDIVNKKIGTSAIHTSNGYIKFVNSSSLTLGSSDFTIAGYYRSSNVSQTAIFYNKRANASTYNSVYVGTVGGNMVASGTTNGSSWNLIPVNTPFGSLTNNTFHHFALVRYGSTLTGYLDGVGTVLTTSAGTVYDAGHNVHIGADTNNYRLKGQLDDLLVLKGQALYLSNFTPPTKAYIEKDTRSHSHVWNYQDIYKARRADTWPSKTFDSRIALYLPFDDDVLDKSIYARTAGVSGGDKIQSSVVKFGNGSAFFDNTDYIGYSSSSNWLFASEDFTVEGFFNASSISTDGLVSVYQNDNRCWQVYFNNSRLHAQISTDGSNDTLTLDSGVTLSTGQWYNFSFTREGSTFRLFVDGVLGATATNSGVLHDPGSNGALYVGTTNVGSPYGKFHGYLDDIRVTKGIAIYTTAYTVPTRAVGGDISVNP